MLSRSLLFAACLSGLLSVSCRGREPYLIGFMGSMTGPNADLGEAGRNGALLAVERVNSEGGVNGRPVELVVMDNGMDESSIAPQFQSLLDRGGEVVIGPLTSRMTRGALPVARKLNLCLVSPSASSEEFFDIDDILLLVSSSSQKNAFAYGEYILNRAGYRSCGIISDRQNGAFTDSWLKAFVSYYTNRGGSILTARFIDSSLNSDFREELEIFLETGAEVLIINANSMDAATIIQEFRKMNKTIPVIVSEWAATDLFIKIGGKAVEGVVFMQPFNPFSESESYREFRSVYTDRYQGEPSYVSVASYDTAIAVLEALGKRNKDESVKNSILRNSPYRGLQQDIVFNSEGDADRDIQFLAVEDGQIRMVE